MLTEEYRPTNLSQIVGQDLNIEIIKGFIKKGKLPHMLFYGPPGTGKTSAILCIAREYYGDDWRSYFIEQNASDDRGIGVVRDKIKREAAIATLDYPFKIYFLDECDALTPEAQDSLRRIIEKNTDRTVFILSCNHKNKLIDPLINRCVPFNFKPLDKESIRAYIKKVAHENNMTIKPPAINLLADFANGSVRPVLNTFEKFIATDIKEITEQYVTNYTGMIIEKIVIQLIGLLKSGGDLSAIDAYIDNVILENGYEPSEILQKMYKYIKDTHLLTEKEKLITLKLIGDVDFRIAEGATPSIQLKTLFAYLLLKMS